MMLGALKPIRQSRPQRGRRATTARACRSTQGRRERPAPATQAARQRSGAAWSRSREPPRPWVPSREPIGAALVAAGRRHRRPTPRKQRRAAAQACRSGSKKHAQGDGSKRAGSSENPDKKAPRRGANHKGAEPLFLILILWQYGRFRKVPVRTLKSPVFQRFSAFCVWVLTVRKKNGRIRSTTILNLPTKGANSPCNLMLPHSQKKVKTGRIRRS